LHEVSDARVYKENAADGRNCDENRPHCFEEFVLGSEYFGKAIAPRGSQESH